VAFRVRGTLRRRWLATLMVAGIVAVVSGAVLTLVAGARRTSTAPDAFTAAVGGDLGGSVTQESGPPRTAEVARLPGVRSVEAMTFMFASVVDPTHESAADTIVFSGSRLSTSRLAAGRAADPTNVHEFVANKKFVSEHQARLGDRYQLVTWTQDQLEQGQAFSGEPQGPSFEAVLVGILTWPETLEDKYATAIVSRALLDDDGTSSSTGIASATTLMAVRLQPGVTTDELRAELDGLPGGDALSLEPGRIISSPVRNAVEAQAQGTWLMAAVAAIAAVVALGQLLSRHARLSPVERRPLAALGFTGGQLAEETIGRAAIPALGGIAAGTIFAVLASGLFPAGFVHEIEPNPGLRADLVVLIVGGGVLLLSLLGWVTVALLTARPSSAGRTLTRTSETFARRTPSAAAATGTRFALTSHERSSTSALGTLLALALIVAGLVGATTFAASLDRLVSDRGRYGGNYTFGLGDISGRSADDLRTLLAGDPDIDGLMILSGAQARAGGATVGLVGMEHVQGVLAPRVLTGRLPVGPDEVALGRLTARQLHLQLGDELALVGAGGSGTYRVVGLAVVPGIGGIDGVGQGGVVTSKGLSRLEPNPDTTMAAITLRRGAPADAGQRIAALVGAQTGTEDPPSAIVNVARVRRIPGLLALLLVALAVLTTVHALIVSIQGRRRDLAVLRALGGDRRWITRAVHWQATVLATAPLFLGVPLGLIAGAVVFRAFVDRIGALPDPAIPVGLVVALIVGLVAVANLAAIVPARRARLIPAAQLLRDE
jgi:putative ABC transport system permease protein